MKNTPIISHLDIAAFGTMDDTVTCYRRVIDENDGSWNARGMAIDEPDIEGQHYSIYRWDDNAGPNGEWQWVGDTELDAEARAAAIEMAGTDQIFTLPT